MEKNDWVNISHKSTYNWKTLLLVIYYAIFSAIFVSIITILGNISKGVFPKYILSMNGNWGIWIAMAVIPFSALFNGRQVTIEINPADRFDFNKIVQYFIYKKNVITTESPNLTILRTRFKVNRFLLSGTDEIIIQTKDNKLTVKLPQNLVYDFGHGVRWETIFLKN